MIIYKNKKRRKLLKPIILVAVIMLSAIVSFDILIRPVVTKIAEYRVNSFVMAIINESIYEHLNTQKYDDLVLVRYDDQNNIEGISVDMQAVTSLKSSLAVEISQKIENIIDDPLGIPLGTLLDSQLFMGRGPIIDIYITPTSYLNSTIHEQFESVGLNQTLYSVYIDFKVSVNLTLPGITSQIDVINDACVASTVVVGEVPDAYTEVHGDNSDFVSKINDYMAVS